MQVLFRSCDVGFNFDSDLLRAVLNFETVSVNSTFVLLPLDFS